MREPIWVLREVVPLAHEQSLAAFGGSAGIRDEGLLDSALGKPHNLFAYVRTDQTWGGNQATAPLTQ
jgi:death-on-curing protein